MPFPYKKVLVIGATSGIGLQFAHHLIKEGVAVIAVGRRQDRLDAFVQETGSEKASAAAFDLTDIDGIPSFAQGIVKAHPDLDCIFLNAGVQYVMDFSKPHTVDIKKIQHEITVNYISIVALTHAFMPFYQAKPSSQEPAFIYTTTSLESVPYPMVLNYCASKSAIRSFILSVREQLKGFNIKLVELYTPLVQTELHNKQPGWGPDFNPGMPVADFINAAMEGFSAKQETVAVGMAKAVWDQFEEARGQRVGPQWELTKKALGSAHQFD
ncbi:MAG: hypothetical protein Q9164_003250 [Protoblastenia rupestris]